MLDRRAQLDRFFAAAEKRAFVRARCALRHEDDALDAVQEAMLKLARRYAAQPPEQWPALFYRILENQITDMQRHRTVRQRVLGWLPAFTGGEAEPDPIARAPDPAAVDPERARAGADAMDALGAALDTLPARQREVFLLRGLEQLSVEDTAAAMGVTAGSVKTHYSRALGKLREMLGDHWQ